MTGLTLIDMLGDRVEDPDDINFTALQKGTALNNAQKTLCGLLHDHYLSDYKESRLDQDLSTLTSGNKGITFESLFSDDSASQFTVSSVYDTLSKTEVDGDSPTDGSQTTFTKTSHGFLDDDVVDLSGFTQMNVNGVRAVVENRTSNTFELKGVLGSPAETTGGTVKKVNANPTQSIFTKVAHGLENDDVVELSNFDVLSELNGTRQIVEGKTSDTFKLKGVLGSIEQSSPSGLASVMGQSSPLGNRIYKVYDRTNERNATFVEDPNFDDKTVYSYGSIWTIVNNELIVCPDNIASINVYYIARPKDIYDSIISTLQLNDMFIPVLLDIAEAEIWFMDNRMNRGNTAHKRALEMIQVYNSRLVIEGKTK